MIIELKGTFKNLLELNCIIKGLYCVVKQNEQELCRIYLEIK